MIKLKKNKNLVICAAGDTSLHKEWCDTKLFDTYLIYFGDKKNYEYDAKFYKKSKGYKYHLIKNVLDESDFWKNYDYIWLPDDDLSISKKEVNRIFELMNLYNLEIGQPSIMGYYGTWITLHQMGSVLRFTNWVEIMCPCFSVAALDVCKQTFKENNCGWGIEGIWNILLNHPKDKIAIIDDIIAKHTRPVLSGDTYKDQHNGFDFAFNEARNVFKKWNLAIEMKKDTKEGKPYNCEVFGAVEYSQIKKEMEKNVNTKDRLWPKT